MAKKSLKRGLALGALMAFVITGSAMASPNAEKEAANQIITDGLNIDVTYDSEATQHGIRAWRDNSITVLGPAIDINIDNAGDAWGVYTHSREYVDDHYEYFSGGKVVLGDDNTVTNININAKGFAVGIQSAGAPEQKGSDVVVNGKSLNIIAHSTNDWAYALNVANTSTPESIGNGTQAKLTINADKTYIEASTDNPDALGCGIVVMSQGILEINSDLEVKADSVIVTRGASKININTDGKHSTVLKGDIEFSYDGPTSSTPIDADVNVTLSGDGSVWQGNAKTTWNEIKESNYYKKEDILKVTGLNITLEEGAKWKVTAPVKNEETKVADTKYVNLYTGQRCQAINNLTMKNGGIVEFSEDVGEATIEIDTLKGSGATFNMQNGNTIKVKALENNDVTLNAGTIKFVGGDTKITGTLTLNKGADIVESNEEGVPAMNLTLAAGSKLVIDNLNNYLEEYNGGETYAVISAKKGTVTAEKGATISIGTADEGTYKIVEAAKVVNNMSDEDVTFDGGLKTGTWINSDKEMNLKVAIKNLEEETALVPTENASLVEDALKNINKLNSNPNTQQLGDFFNKISQLAEQANTGSGSVTPPQVKAAIASSVQSGTNNGAASTAASVVNNVSGITNNRMSIVTPAPKGGRGVGLFAEESGAGVWAQYLHGKDKAEDLPSGSSKTQYKNSYNGILVGADFKKVYKFQSGIAFSYTDGDGSNSSTTGGTLGSTGHTDFKSYGVTYYGSIKNDTTNTMFDIGYNHSKADSDTNILLTGHTDSSTSKTNTWSAGVTVEKSYTDGNNGAQFIPYVGVRYMNINTDDFTTKMGYHNAMDDQNVFLIPVGIKFRQENVYKNGWKVTPKADLSYVWATGDTDSNVNVTIPGLPSEASVIGYTVMDDGSFLGTVGIEAAKGDWTYGLSYSYQKGEYQRSDKWFVDVRYSF